MPCLPLVIISHPAGGLKPEKVKEKADRIIEDLIRSSVSWKEDMK